MSVQPYDRALLQDSAETTFLTSVLKRTSWGAVFAGAVAAITIQMLLSVLGVAIGVTAASGATSMDPETAGRFTVAAGLWWLVTGTLSLFLGGCVVGRFAGMIRSPDVLLHAFTMWGITALFGLIAVSAGAGALYSTAINSSYRGAGLDFSAAAGSQPAGDVRAAETGAGVGDGRSVNDVEQAVRTASWWTLGVLLLGMGASLAGCWVATPRRIALTSPSRHTALNPSKFNQPHPHESPDMT